ncbi:unnamed protein product [Calicophoron daubneyi]|uniref:NADH dehydrogenase subunit 5 n=1 Tax=Calicophoron daubneyi TaxID=300641 RepID=A0AAV2TV22_CALDB
MAPLAIAFIFCNKRLFQPLSKTFSNLLCVSTAPARVYAPPVSIPNFMSALLSSILTHSSCAPLMVAFSDLFSYSVFENEDVLMMRIMTDILFAYTCHLGDSFLVRCNLAVLLSYFDFMW